MRTLLLALLFSAVFGRADARVLLGDAPPARLPLTKSLLMADAGTRELRAADVYRNAAGLTYRTYRGRAINLGFTMHNFWGRFRLKNTGENTLHYYLEAGVPMTDVVNCYVFEEHTGKYTLQKSGDRIAFDDRSVDSRRPLFRLELKPGEEKTVLIELRNDGERNNFQPALISERTLLSESYSQQGVLGVFYGMLLIISLTYLFFYFALNERSFLYYSLYVVFAGLCQFALDGLFNQYIDRSASWLSLHAVILSAVFAAFFFGRYTETVLNINPASQRVLFLLYRVIYVLLGFTLACIVLIPAFRPLSYPVVNILTLLGMTLIFATVSALLIRGHRIDPFFIAGIAFLFLTIASVIASNFNLFGDLVSVDDITKIGMGLEFVALSLSMANRIYYLKSEKEKLQATDLQRCKEINDIKSFFLSNMSHELRTPLNAILGISTIMEEEAPNPAARSQSVMISEASRSLIASVNDILDYSLIERGELTLDAAPFQPYAILAKASQAMGQKARENRLDYTFHGRFDRGLTVNGDAARLGQIVYNILSNAVKFTPAGSVRFTADAREEDGYVHLQLRVEDTGIGIPAEKLAAGFELFAQHVMDNKRRFGGFGIGLCVVNALVNMHGGRFSLESTVGVGTRCEIMLSYPLVTGAPFLPVKTAHPNRKPECRNILVVEDNPINQNVMKMILKKWDNVFVHFAADGAQGLSVLRDVPDIDLVLLDLQMPVMDGYEMLSALRRGEAGDHYRQAAVLVLTADVLESTRKRVFELGADDYMTKPVDKDLLFKKAQILLSREKIMQPV